KEHQQREDEEARDAEDDGRGAKAGDGQQERPPGALERRSVREEERDARRADGRGRAQPAEPFGSDLQDILREDRQQRRRAAEQYGEEVQRHRREQDRRAPQKG